MPLERTTLATRRRQFTVTVVVLVLLAVLVAARGIGSVGPFGLTLVAALLVVGCMICTVVGRRRVAGSGRRRGRALALLGLLAVVKVVENGTEYRCRTRCSRLVPADLARRQVQGKGGDRHLRGARADVGSGRSSTLARAGARRARVRPWRRGDRLAWVLLGLRLARRTTPHGRTSSRTLVQGP